MNNILILLFSLTGIIFGMLLSLISPEEMQPGRKYFQWLRRAFLAAAFLFISFSFISRRPLALSFLLVLTVLLFLDFKVKNKVLFFSPYLFFIIAYFLMDDVNLRLASIIFIYGLPAGTLLRIKDET